MDKVNSNYQLWLYQEYSEELKKGLRPELIAHLRLFQLNLDELYRNLSSILYKHELFHIIVNLYDKIQNG